MGNRIIILYMYWENSFILLIRKVKVKVAQLYLTLFEPMGNTAHGILQARISEGVTFPSSRGSSQPRDQTQVSLIAGRILYQLIRKEWVFPLHTVLENVYPMWVKYVNVKVCSAAQSCLTLCHLIDYILLSMKLSQQ